MKVLKLPKSICSLDIETGSNRELLLAGIVPYYLHRGSYWPGRYKWFTPATIKQLEEFLKHFPGIILGHNIINFDYRILARYISLEGIIDKTVDTLYFLHGKHGFRTAGLGLDALSRLNLGRRKIYLNARNLGRLWRHGHRRKVLEYNKTDCLLTKALWWHLLKEQSVEVQFKDSYESFMNNQSYPIVDEDRTVLVGKKPLLTFQIWRQHLHENSDILKTKNISRDVFYWFYCRPCSATYLFQSSIRTGSRVRKEVHCAECKILLGEARQDFGCKLLGSHLGKLADGYSTSCVPEEFRELLMKYLQDNSRATDGYFFITDRKTREVEADYFVKTTDGTVADITIQWVYCDKCLKTFVYEHRSQKTKQRKFIACPGCKESLALVDMSGRQFFIGDINIDLGRGSSHGCVREELSDIVRAYLETLPSQ